MLSPTGNFINRMYQLGFWTAQRVQQAVTSNLITQAEADIILGN